MLVILDEGEGKSRNLGQMSLAQALDVARERDLDLVEVSGPDADPTVCKVMDYGKFLYNKKKKEREERKKQKTIEVKEIRLRPKTDTHHLDIKVKNARKWLDDGMKVKVRIWFRGREITYPELGREILDYVAEKLSDVAVIEQSANMDGRTMLMILAPASNKKK